MKGTLLGFLIVLANFPDILERFRADPDAVAKEYGLSDKELAAIKSNDYRKVEEVLRAESHGTIQIQGEPPFGTIYHAVDISKVTAFLTPLEDDKGKR